MKTIITLAIIITLATIGVTQAQYSKPEVIYLDADSGQVKNWQSSAVIIRKEQVNDSTWQQQFYITGKPIKHLKSYKDEACTVLHGTSLFYNETGRLDSAIIMNEGLRVGVNNLYKALFATDQPQPADIKRWETGLTAFGIIPTDPLTPEATISGPAAQEKFIEIDSRFPGGNLQFISVINSGIKYPAQSVKKRITGRVIAQFIVDQDGSIADVNLIKSVEYLLDQELIRVIKGVKEKWIPATQNGEPVRSVKALPLNFGLGL